jgi:hypothetical protein
VEAKDVGPSDCTKLVRILRGQHVFMVWMAGAGFRVPLVQLLHKSVKHSVQSKADTVNDVSHTGLPGAMNKPTRSLTWLMGL